MDEPRARSSKSNRERSQRSRTQMQLIEETLKMLKDMESWILSDEDDL